MHARAGRAGVAGWLLLVFALACSSQAGRDESRPDPLRVDDTGHGFVDAAPAQRIVSLIPATTEILFALGAGPSLVARTDYCDHPPEARELPSVGSGIRPAVESILAFRPDLVVLFAGPDNAPSIERLRDLGAPVFAVRHNTIDDLFRNVRRLGALTGRTDAADSLAVAIRSGLDSIARAAGPGPGLRVYYDLWGEPPYTIGRGSYLSDLIRIAGGRNAFDHLDAPSPQVNVEAIIEARPAVILVPTAQPGVDPLVRLRARSGWSAIPAVREGRVAALDADLVHRLGPRLPEAARALAHAIRRAAEAHP